MEVDIFHSAFRFNRLKFHSLRRREEQRDDKILHELLRCLKAISTSSIGCFALRTSCPTPWNRLIVLLYSDKKPGDVSTRQQMIDLLRILFELYPSTVPPSSAAAAPASLPSSGLPRPSPATPPMSPIYAFPPPHSSVFSLIRSMLLASAPTPAEQVHAPIQPHTFIESIRIPRIYKTYLQELSDICRDYFWVFCHPQNTIWNLKETDIDRVEAPRAPGGMTGGVEYEAMGYMVRHIIASFPLVSCPRSLLECSRIADIAFKIHQLSRQRRCRA